MNVLVIDFEKDNSEFESVVIDVFGEEIKQNFLEVKAFNGDFMEIIVSILIPVTMPFVSAGVQISLNKHKEENSEIYKDINSKKVVKITLDNEKYVFKNYDLDEIKSLLISVKKECK